MENTMIHEDLRAWFGKGGKGGVGGGGWDRYNSSGDRIGKCGDAKEGDPYSACLSKEKARKLGKAGRAAFVKRKRAAQKKAGDAKKGGERSKGQKPIKVKTEINEIGEATSKPYKYKVTYQDEEEIQYEFTTDSKLRYQISIAHKGITRTKTRLVVAFKPLTGNYDTITNKGEHFRIMATVVAAVKEYLATVPTAAEISFTPSKADEGDMRRANLYKAYIAKHLPGSKIDIFSDGRYIVILPKKKMKEIALRESSSNPYGHQELEEQLNLFLEKNAPTNPSKWAYYVSQAKKKFDVYPSAYANAWAAKQYKKAGGGWRKAKKESVLKLESDLLGVSKPYEIIPGDRVRNINPTCTHYKSTGEVMYVHGSGDITYKVDNMGTTYTVGDVLKKSSDQLMKVFMRTPRPGYGMFSNE